MSQRTLAGTSAICLVALSTIACARTASPDAQAAARPSEVKQTPIVAATVFTDTALFRQMCTESDSGLSPGAGRCTPRDQSLPSLPRKRQD